jgi:hypothetical protein
MRALLAALRGRSRRGAIAAGLVAMLAIVGSLAAVYARREDVHVSAAEARVCARAVGTFSFTGRVTDAVPRVNHEQWSAYRVRLEERAACRYEVEITKYTDDAATGFYDWRGSVHDVPAVVRPDGTLALDTQLTLYRPSRTEPYEHAFELLIKANELTGTFDVLDRRSGFSRVYGGRIAGRRDRGAHALERASER